MYVYTYSPAGHVAACLYLCFLTSMLPLFRFRDNFLEAWNANPGDWEFAGAFKQRSVAQITQSDVVVSGKTRAQLEAILGDEAEGFISNCISRQAMYTENGIKFYEWTDRRALI